MSSPLGGKVCIVTGATRGIGKGIALQLGEKGAKVYITGRTLDSPKERKVGGSLRETALEIEDRGGICIPVQCDHSKDDDIERLFEQVKRENDGQLDILVNNAYSAVNSIFNNTNLPFWEQSPSMWDEVNNVGLRNHYICSVYAARIMVPRKKGLIVNVSSLGGLKYALNVAYGVGKEACDRMAADCGHELKKHNVACVSIWPGAVGTETVLSLLRENIENQKLNLKNIPLASKTPDKMLEFFEKAETTEFAGQCIAAMATDPDLMQMSGKIVMTCELARRYGLKDTDGHEPMEMRQVNVLLRKTGHTWLAMLTPNCVRIPKWVLALAGNKFF